MTGCVSGWRSQSRRSGSTSPRICGSPPMTWARPAGGYAACATGPRKGWMSRGDSERPNRPGGSRDRTAADRGLAPDAVVQRLASPMTKVRPAHFVAGGGRLLDHPGPIVWFGLQLQDDAAVADALGFQDFVVLAATMNIGDWVARTERLDRHEFAGA